MGGRSTFISVVKKKKRKRRRKLLGETRNIHILHKEKFRTLLKISKELNKLKIPLLLKKEESTTEGCQFF